jgi:serine/threonine-protein kinase
MSQRFIRCRHCGLPHGGGETICPSTGKAIRGKSRSAPDQVAPSAPAIPVPPPSRRPPPRTLIGKVIDGRYRVRGLLGEGGMGTVFEAEHMALGRSVAVKVLHATQATRKEAIRRFQQEARAAGAIGHPNICGVTDLGTLDDGSPYMVMERLVGETLADRVASERGLPFEDVIDILVQVLSGLVAAHEQRIVHRDIKPDNVFLTARVGCPPVVKLLDFGVSKMMGETPAGSRQDDLTLTRTGMVMGTPYYMAPEQARGEPDVDARVDLYACGVIMYESLTGKRPFTAANYNALLLQILSGTPRSASALRPALPASYGAVIEKAMARRREDRYATAAEFQRDLKRLRDRHKTPPTGSVAPAFDARASRDDASVRRMRAVEVSSSSAEIPVTVASETGLFVVDPTEVHLRPPADRDTSEDPTETRDEKRSDGAEEHAEGDGDEDPTQLMAPVNPRRR